MNKIYILFSILTVGCLVGTAFGQTNSDNDFSIYLLPKHIKISDLAALDLTKVELQGKPFIHQNDIFSYNKDTHQFRNFDAELEAKIKKLRIPTDGLPFVATVGNTPIYSGAFYTKISSQSFAGITITIPDNKKPYFWQINLGYPSETFFKGKDLRGDPRILKAFESKKKLYEDLEIIGKCKEIRSSGKRVATAYFTFQVLSVTKSSFAEKEIVFELSMHREGSKLLEALKKSGSGNGSKEWKDYDKEKKMILRFEQNLSDLAQRDYKLIFKDFSNYKDK